MNFNKIFLTGFIALGLVFLLFKTNTTANTLADVNDVFKVIEPAPNKKLKGEVNVSWIMYDDDNENIPFVAEILDSQNCTQNFGSITSASTGQSSQTDPYTVTWNTNSTLTNNLNDGDYCLRICLQLQNENYYSVCNSRIVTITNQNELPTFTKFPNDLILNENEQFTFKLEGFDADGDTISFRIKQAPSFVTLNGSNLKIQTPTISQGELTYTVIISIDDGLSGEVEQQFKLTVKNLDTQVSESLGSNQSQNNSNSNQPNEEQDNGESMKEAEISLEFLSPKSDQIIENNLLEIVWEISPDSQTKSQILEYSSNLETFFQIAELENNERKFSWDVSSLSEGVYYLRIKVQFDNGIAISKVSPKFVVNQNETITSIPLILNVKPEIDSTVTEVKTIEGKLVPSQNSSIDEKSLRVYFDGKDISENCEVIESEFRCIITTDLAKEGLHNVKVEIGDTSGAANSFDWQFRVDPTPLEREESQNKHESLILFNREINPNSIFIVLLICFSSLVLLFVPWFLYALWRRDTDELEEEIKTTESEIITEQYQIPATDTTITTNYYTPPTYNEPQSFENKNT
ncbi:MAG: hypothetical protein KatS3mg085_444 [Candidatus Dojkabacteria bacterium]|nr:MAG: hypothetical protein KatS3mg085_444 [Candidatus Dojkabacteria bacterium]